MKRKITNLFFTFLTGLSLAGSVPAHAGWFGKNSDGGYDLHLKGDTLKEAGEKMKEAAEVIADAVSPSKVKSIGIIAIGIAAALRGLSFFRPHVGSMFSKKLPNAVAGGSLFTLGTAAILLSDRIVKLFSKN